MSIAELLGNRLNKANFRGQVPFMQLKCGFKWKSVLPESYKLYNLSEKVIL